MEETKIFNTSFEHTVISMNMSR